MLFPEILDLVVPIKIQLNKTKPIAELEEQLLKIQGEVIPLITDRSDLITKADDILYIKKEIIKVSDALSLMAILIPEGVKLFGKCYNDVHPERQKKRRKKSFSDLLFPHSTSSGKEKRPLFKRKRRLDNSPGSVSGS